MTDKPHEVGFSGSDLLGGDCKDPRFDLKRDTSGESAPSGAAQPEWTQRCAREIIDSNAIVEVRGMNVIGQISAIISKYVAGPESSPAFIHDLYDALHGDVYDMAQFCDKYGIASDNLSGQEGLLKAVIDKVSGAAASGGANPQAPNCREDFTSIPDKSDATVNCIGETTMQKFTIKFHVECENREQADQWRKNALQILDASSTALGYTPDESGDRNGHCSGHVEEDAAGDEPAAAPFLKESAEPRCPKCGCVHGFDWIPRPEHDFDLLNCRACKAEFKIQFLPSDCAQFFSAPQPSPSATPEVLESLAKEFEGRVKKYEHMVSEENSHGSISMGQIYNGIHSAYYVAARDVRKAIASLGASASPSAPAQTVSEALQHIAQWCGIAEYKPDWSAEKLARELMRKFREPAPTSSAGDREEKK